MLNTKELRLSEPRKKSFGYLSPYLFDCDTPNPVFAMVRGRKLFRPKSPIICKIYVPPQYV